MTEQIQCNSPHRFAKIKLQPKPKRLTQFYLMYIKYGFLLITSLDVSENPVKGLNSMTGIERVRLMILRMGRQG